MRPLIIPFAIWLGVLQAPIAPEHGLTAIVATASALAGLTVLVYRLRRAGGPRCSTRSTTWAPSWRGSGRSRARTSCGSSAGSP